MPNDAAPPTRLRGWLVRLLAAVTVAYTIVLVLATHYPRPREFLGESPPSDKTLHFIAYAVLGVFAGGTLVLARRWTGIWTTRLAACLVAFAAIDEVTQPFFSRSADPVDWLYDCAGITLGLAAVAVSRAIVRRVCGGHTQLGVGGR